MFVDYSVLFNLVSKVVDTNKRLHKRIGVGKGQGLVQLSTVLLAIFSHGEYFCVSSLCILCICMGVCDEQIHPQGQ